VDVSAGPRIRPAVLAELDVDLPGLRRETRAALELAVVAPAPPDLIDRLAGATGLLDVIAELPLDSPPVSALVPKLAKQARSALSEWAAWQARRSSKPKA
jgi:hypothetical protein